MKIKCLVCKAPKGRIRLQDRGMIDKWFTTYYCSWDCLSLLVLDKIADRLKPPYAIKGVAE